MPIMSVQVLRSTDTEPRRADFVDALRGYAALGVIIVHAGQYVPGMDDWTAWGAKGVQLFFVVSAFTLMASWNARNDGALAFYLRRLFRIVPMFWIALAVYYLLRVDGIASFGPFEVLPQHILQTAVLAHGLNLATLGNGVVPGGWTVGNEMIFYVFFPLLAIALTSRKSAAMGFVASCCIGVLYWYAFYMSGEAQTLYPQLDPYELKAAVYKSLPFQASTFFAGILAYRLVASKNTSSIPLRLGLPLSAAALVIVYFTEPHFIPAYAAIFAAITVCMSHGYGTALVTRPICYLGKISFSAYLLHFAGLGPGIAFASKCGLTGSWAFCLSLPATVLLTGAAAALCYRYVEQPCIVAGNKLIRTYDFSRSTTAA